MQDTTLASAIKTIDSSSKVKSNEVNFYATWDIDCLESWIQHVEVGGLNSCQAFELGWF
jgi:hypothetical protein